MTKLTTSSYIKITLIVLIALLLGGFALFGSACASWGFSMGGGASMGNANVSTQGIRAIDIDWAAGSVDVRPYEGTDIELVETADRGISKAQGMRWDVKGDTLKVDYGGWMSCLSFTSKHLTVNVPRALASQLDDLDINGASGNYQVTDIGCRTFDFDLASGKLEAQGLTTDELKVDVASGKAFVEGSVANKARLHAASGRIEVTLRDKAPHTIDADLASGNVTVSLPADTGFTARVDKASGNFSTEFSTDMRSDNTYVCGNGETDIKVGMASGHFALNKTA
ncbi:MULTISPECIES: DUF4097 family beta strand repeat-containing protein [Gordonibacter]|uniref:DUF4097 family beta strand repeat-containing protein n=1 Tax=Gordonibacter faecis TaxID=3047475 RepID=A0ABT7DQR0_9ACTN|nr:MULTISPECIES: DUF4097 family beta strand repeat-containing protein [unclassified Gordonibacter]MDJ1650495.1 DUF4097 family beta strand repeat-containing protein [Gordonibacter sp. KGMB12511]HIW77422.1 DUF4097 domain-containing protein [Candidatus Gordonibacter avicola]